MVPHLDVPSARPLRVGCQQDARTVQAKKLPLGRGLRRSRDLRAELDLTAPSRGEATVLADDLHRHSIQIRIQRRTNVSVEQASRPGQEEARPSLELHSLEDAIAIAGGEVGRDVRAYVR